MNSCKNILIIDDNVGLCESLSDSLEADGYVVQTAETGSKAVDLCGINVYDIAVVDISLPDISGIKLVETIAVLSPITEYIYMTGQASVATAIEAVKQKNVISYETKPLNISRFLALIKQVVDRRQIDKKLRESEVKIRKLSHAIDQSSSTIVITDAKGNIEFVNPRFTELTGYTIEEVIGKNTHILKSGETPQEVYKELWKAISSGNEWRGEFCNRKKNGELYWESASISPVKNDKGVITNLIAVKDDVTEQKKMEEALLQSEKLKSIGTITAGISHEFNNILAIISGKVQLMQMDYEDDAKLKDELSIILKAADDGATISRKMLKFTKTNQNTKEFVSSDINNLIIDSIDFTKPRWKNEAQAKGIDYYICKEALDIVPAIMCNPTELREVLINIIKNALDAMPEGGSISFSTYCNDNNVYAGISDTGKGMSENVMQSIFDPFFTTRTPEGTGLGLSMAYGIMTSHGGKISVESEPGKGSSFKLQFPIDTKAPSAIATSEPKQDSSNEKLRILVVDDDDYIRNILYQFLSRDGHKIQTIDNGADAIKIIESEDFDLVLCDLAMPGVFGYDVVKALNSLKKRPKIGIISGFNEKSEREGGGEVKVDFYLKKPFKRSALTRHINELFP